MTGKQPVETLVEFDAGGDAHAATAQQQRTLRAMQQRVDDQAGNAPEGGFPAPGGKPLGHTQRAGPALHLTQGQVPHAAMHGGHLRVGVGVEKVGPSLRDRNGRLAPQFNGGTQRAVLWQDREVGSIPGDHPATGDVSSPGDAGREPDQFAPPGADGPDNRPSVGIVEVLPPQQLDGVAFGPVAGGPQQVGQWLEQRRRVFFLDAERWLGAGLFRHGHPIRPAGWPCMSLSTASATTTNWERRLSSHPAAYSPATSQRSMVPTLSLASG